MKYGTDVYELETLVDRYHAPSTPGGRIATIMQWLNPGFDEDDKPLTPLITPEEARRLLEMPP